MERPRRAELLLLLALALAPSAVLAQAQEPMVVRLRNAVGDTIDLAERDSFRLFPNTAGFQQAVFLALPGPEFFAKVTQSGPDTPEPVYYRILPGQLERIQFLIDNHQFVAEQQLVDTTAARSLTSFWQSIESRPLRSIPGKPAELRDIRRLPAGEAAAGDTSPQPDASYENRYSYALHGATLGSIAGGCIGSHAGIKYVRTESPECFPAYDVFHVDPCVFWGTSCGITALGTCAGYAVGSRFDHDEPEQMARLKEGTSWRTGLAIGALIPGLALGYFTFWVTGFSRYGVLSDVFDVIDNDPEGWTTLPMAFTGLCIAVESATIGYRIGRAIDRRNAEEAAAKRRALGH